MATLVGAAASPAGAAQFQSAVDLPCCAPPAHLGLNRMAQFRTPISRFRKRQGLRCCGESRKGLVEATSAGSNTEKNFKTTKELDKLIDRLRATESAKLPQVVAENILAFNTVFWLRLAARADLAALPDDQREFAELAKTVMTIVQVVVQKAEERIESSTDVLMSILTPLIDENGEISWPPSDPQGISMMRKEVQRREEGGYLDESFLIEVSAQMRKAREDEDKPGLVAILQKILQLYCSTVLCRRTYATKGGEVDKAEELLEMLISADEEDWNELIRSRLVFGGGTIEPDEFFVVLEKRVERTLMQTEGGSYQQRLLAEYVREIQTRAELLVEAFKTPPSS